MTSKQRRNERQQKLNMMFSVLPPFHPVNDYYVYLINHSTPTILMQSLIELARQTTTFTVDTEQDYYSHQPALIQIEMIREQSVVILVETCHLPHPASISFWLVQALFKAILKRDNLILGWGNIVDELTAFIDYGLFTWDLIKQINMIDVQSRFKSWYNRQYLHGCGLLPEANDHIICTCPYRLVKHENHRWSLQKAIGYLFDEFLDKSRTKSNWDRRLDSKDIRRFTITNRNEDESRELIAYAVNDCLAVTKLFTTMQDGVDPISRKCVFLYIFE